MTGPDATRGVPAPAPTEAPTAPSTKASAGVPTGDAAVDAGLAPLAGLRETPVTAHPAAYEEVHRRLHAALREPAGDVDDVDDANDGDARAPRRGIAGGGR